MSILNVLKQRPDLTVEGINRRRCADFAEEQAKLVAATAEFEQAVAWFSLVPKLKTAVIGGCFWSYKIKSEIQSWWGVKWMPNGVAIAAALHLGFPIKDGDKKNCWIGASKKRPAAPTAPAVLPPPPY